MRRFSCPLTDNANIYARVSSCSVTGLDNNMLSWHASLIMTSLAHAFILRSNMLSARRSPILTAAKPIFEAWICSTWQNTEKFGTAVPRISIASHSATIQAARFSFCGRMLSPQDNVRFQNASTALALRHMETSPGITSFNVAIRAPDMSYSSSILLHRHEGNSATYDTLPYS